MYNQHILKTIAMRSLLIAYSLIAPTQAAIISIGTMAEFNALTTRKQPVVVQFAAEWCSMCKSVKQPLLEVMQEKEFAHITFARVDEDAAPQVSTSNSIVGFPTFMFFNNGLKKYEQVGVKKVARFKDELRTNLRRYCLEA